MTYIAAAQRLSDRLAQALRCGDAAQLDQLRDVAPVDERDRLVTLQAIYDLHYGPLERVGDAARWQHHPAVAALKQRCEAAWLAELESVTSLDGVPVDDPVEAMRRLAASDRLPPIYKWLARRADWDDVVRFLALEGGPDADFDDLVAICQVGLAGSAKLELATNYWDEMGNGDLSGIHTVLHDQLVEAIDLPRIAGAELPVSALARTAFGGLLATNRWLQPEMLGALGLIELQAGPRSRMVLQALERCDGPAAAYPFYAVHAEVDPRHGKDWLEKAITPTVRAHPEWGERIVRGVVWRAAINAKFFEDVSRELGVSPAALAA